MKLTVYTKPGCQQCIATKKTLERDGHEVAFVDITQDADAEATVRGLGYQSLPVVVVSRTKHWAGFRPDLIKELAP